MLVGERLERVTDGARCSWPTSSSVFASIFDQFPEQVLAHAEGRVDLATRC